MTGEIISLTISIIYTIIAYHFKDIGTAGVVFVATLVPLILIWFGDTIGNYTGPNAYGVIIYKTPGPLIKLLGWMLLIGLPLLPALIHLITS